MCWKFITELGSAARSEGVMRLWLGLPEPVSLLTGNGGVEIQWHRNETDLVT